MFKLQELKDCWESLDDMLREDGEQGGTLAANQRKALEVSSQMMAALVIQLESQSISFTP